MKNKRIEYWNKIRTEVLMPMFAEKGIKSCELRLKDCTGSLFLGFAHRRSRRHYYTYSNPDQLGAFSEVLLSCQPCHKKIDADKELKVKTFKRLREG